MAAIMVLHGHVKDNIGVLSENGTLLKLLHNFVGINEEDLKQQGAYLYYDTNDEKWIRSGKANHFFNRHLAHKKNAAAQFVTSKFYI